MSSSTSKTLLCLPGSLHCSPPMQNWKKIVIFPLLWNHFFFFSKLKVLYLPRALPLLLVGLGIALYFVFLLPTSVAVHGGADTAAVVVSSSEKRAGNAVTAPKPSWSGCDGSRGGQNLINRQKKNVLKEPFFDSVWASHFSLSNILWEIGGRRNKRVKNKD